MMNFAIAKRAIQFCPLCGLIADNSGKGLYCACPHCEINFRVMASHPIPEGTKKSEKVCERKHKHESIGEALAAWYEIKDRVGTEDNDESMGVYLCNNCGRFHLGHIPQSGARYRTFWTIVEAQEEAEAITSVNRL